MRCDRQKQKSAKKSDKQKRKNDKKNDKPLKNVQTHSWQFFLLTIVILQRGVKNELRL